VTRKTAPDLARLPIAFDLRAISIEEGVRAGLAVATLVAASTLLHQPLLIEAGLGALLTCLCDTAGGLVRRRVPVLLTFALLGGAMVAAFGLLRPLGYAAIPLACAAIFCASFARLYGQSAQQLGTLLSVVLVLALDRSLTAFRPALILAAAFTAGGLWALLLTMVIWRLHPNRPARQAVARVYLALAALCEDLAHLNAQDPAEQDWERHARAHRRAIRDTIEIARDMVGQRLRVSGVAALPAAQSLLRLESADQIFALLIALADLLETTPALNARSLCAEVATVLRGFAPAIVQDNPAGLQALSADIEHIAALATSDDRLRNIARQISERLRVTLTLCATAETLPGATPTPPLADHLIAPLRANLTWQSAALRHASRVALVSAAGFAITFTWPTHYQYWLTITLVLTLQPYYALTLQRALERIGGTVAGGLIAAALGIALHSPLAIAAALLPLSVIALALRSVNYGLYIAALTPMIVLLVEFALPNQAHLAIAAMRALYTLIGGALAVLGCIFLWPSWEPDRLPRELRAAVRANGLYAASGLRLIEGSTAPREAHAARREAGMASNNLEASLSRALVEPGRGGRDALQAAMAVDATLRRIAGRIAALQADPSIAADPALPAWRAWLETVTPLLDETIPPALPAPPQTLPTNPTLREALLRIARQFDLAAGALRRYGAA
jgi:uncharacterized membrane protein YccC